MQQQLAIEKEEIAHMMMAPYSVASLRIFFKVVTKKFKLPQYFSWYHFVKKNEIRNYFYWIGWTSYKFYPFVL